MHINNTVNFEVMFYEQRRVTKVIRLFGTIQQLILMDLPYAFVTKPPSAWYQDRPRSLLPLSLRISTTTTIKINFISGCLYIGLNSFAYR